MSNKNIKQGSNEDKRVKSRRNKELGPPSGWKERRHSIEKRKPEVEEGCLDEWEALMGKSHIQVSQETQDDSASTDWDGLKQL